MKIKLCKWSSPLPVPHFPEVGIQHEAAPGTGYQPASRMVHAASDQGSMIERTKG